MGLGSGRLCKPSRFNRTVWKVWMGSCSGTGLLVGSAVPGDAIWRLSDAQKARGTSKITQTGKLPETIVELETLGQVREERERERMMDKYSI